MPPTTTLNEPKKTAASVDPGGALAPTLLSDFERALAEHPTARIAQNAVTKTPVTDVALDRSVVTGIDHSFSHRLDAWEVTNQKKSGRCWMFAALNLFRVGAMQKMNVESFEFSQNYTLFWDKLERANYFLEAIIATADRDVDDRTVAFLLDRPLEDGGQWNMFVNVVKKHGVVPQSVMPETESSSNTRAMNGLVIHKLREGARELRQLRANGAPMEAARAAKQEILQVVHRMLSIHLGTPPTRFDWQWNDKDKVFHRDGEMTPHRFAEKYIDLPVDEYVCLVHDPRPSSPYGRTFTVEFLGNVVGGDMVRYLNVEIDLIKQIAASVIASGEPVWFGCDVGKMMQRDMGLWDRALFDFDRLYDTEFDLDKPGRLEYHQTLMTHAMLFTGVDLIGDRPRRWRVENSWGDENGEKGFFAMNDSWFDEHMFEIAARKSALPADLQEALDLEPIVLPAWDPMG
ncbi:MAG: C1 family peptidase, partial [Phycisphaerae bacterium]|nr:C1 family peptidase [Phycisphaerae bacterium]